MNHLNYISSRFAAEVVLKVSQTRPHRQSGADDETELEFWLLFPVNFFFFFFYLSLN